MHIWFCRPRTSTSLIFLGLSCTSTLLTFLSQAATSVLNAVLSDFSSPPSAIRLLTSRSVMNRWPALSTAASLGPATIHKLLQRHHNECSFKFPCIETAQAFVLNFLNTHEYLSRRYLPATGSRADRARALSSAVGSSSGQPLRSTF